MKKLLSFVLACMICLGVASPAQAATYDMESGEAETTETPTTWEFVRQYTDYYILNGNYQLVVEDPNYDIFDDRHITISLISDDGPTELDVIVYSKKDGASKWETAGTGTINKTSACSFTITENYTFRVEAKATAGRHGYATIQVVLT